MIELPSELDEDSPDLTDEQVNSAIVVPSVDAMIAHLKNRVCAVDGLTTIPHKHSLRRRAPFFYSVTELLCGNGYDHHVEELVFRVDWLAPGST